MTCLNWGRLEESSDYTLFILRPSPHSSYKTLTMVLPLNILITELLLSGVHDPTAIHVNVAPVTTLWPHTAQLEFLPSEVQLSCILHSFTIMPNERSSKLVCSSETAITFHGLTECQQGQKSRRPTPIPYQAADPGVD